MLRNILNDNGLILPNSKFLSVHNWNQVNIEKIENLGTLSKNFIIYFALLIRLYVLFQTEVVWSRYTTNTTA
jgi:hypothetical protein